MRLLTTPEEFAERLREVVAERNRYRDAVQAWALSSFREDADQKLLAFWESITKE